MKTNYPIIKLCLRTNKSLVDGTHPIMLRCSWKGRKEISTHFSCLPNQWDEKNERLKKNYPNAATVNKIIAKLKSDAIARMDNLLVTGGDLTPDAILCSEEPETTSQKSLKVLYDEYVREKHLRFGTGRKYGCALRAIQRFYGRNDIEVTEITTERIRALAEHEKKRGQKDASVIQVLNTLNAVCGYAVEKGLIEKNPFSGYRYKHDFHPNESSVYLHRSCLEWLKKDLTIYLEQDPLLPLKTRDRRYAIYFYMLCVLMQGLAPVDMVLLKKSQLELKRINDKWYYAINTKRSKTGVPVRIRIAKDDYSNAMLLPLQKHDSEYLLPYLKGNPSEKEIISTLSNEQHFMNNCLRWWWQRLNRVVGSRFGAIKFPENATLYSARHSFAQLYLSQGGNPLQLATLLGRSVNGISVYVKLLTNESDLAEAVDMLAL